MSAEFKSYFKRNLHMVVGPLLRAMEDISEQEFLRHYNMESCTTVINGDTVTETTSEAVATTTKSVVSGNDTITTTIVPVDGNYDYIRTTTITESNGVETLTSVYQRVAKEQE